MSNEAIYQRLPQHVRHLQPNEEGSWTHDFHCWQDPCTIYPSLMLKNKQDQLVEFQEEYCRWVVLHIIIIALCFRRQILLISKWQSKWVISVNVLSFVNKICFLNILWNLIYSEQAKKKRKQLIKKKEKKNKKSYKEEDKEHKKNNNNKVNNNNWEAGERTK